MLDDEMKTKWMLTSVLVLGLGFWGFVGWYQWDSSRNRGYTFGYYGEFNTVGNALAALPGITVVDSGGNKDVSFEEFHFDVRTAEGDQLRLWFGEKDPIRRMSGDKLTQALQDKIKEESSNTPLERTSQ